MIRSYYKRVGLEETVKCQIYLWGYALVFAGARGVYFYHIMYNFMITPVLTVFLKFFCCAFVTLSHGWLLFLFGMLWKSLPSWFPDPEKAKKYTWWITGRKIYAKYVKGQPFITIYSVLIILFSGILPFIYGCYVNYNHYMENLARDQMVV